MKDEILAGLVVPENWVIFVKVDLLIANTGLNHPVLRGVSKAMSLQATFKQDLFSQVIEDMKIHFES